jgi:squalene-hopene/tetraprenyl-beta-curcumene cyclase
MRKTSRRMGFASVLCLSAAVAARPAWAADQKFGADAQKLAEARQKAIDFLKATQAGDGTWTSNTSTGVTALAITALLRSGVPVTDQTVAKGLSALEKYVQKDGGIYDPSTSHKNYETCVAVVALKAADADGRFDQILSRADKFLRGLQWDEEEGIDKSDVRFGGA